MTRVICLCTMIATYMACVVSAYPQGYEGTSNAQFLHGKDLTTLTLEHVGSYRSFAHFGFIDIFYQSGNAGIDAYMEWYPKWVLKSFDAQQRTFFKEIYAGAGINVQARTDFLALLAGPVWQFNVPSFDLFQLETYYYRQVDENENHYKGTFQITYSWTLPLKISTRISLLTRGFIDYIGDRGPGTFQLVTQPQLLLDVGNIWDRPDKFYTGTEWNHWENMGGMEDARRSIVQFEIIWFF